MAIGVAIGLAAAGTQNQSLSLAMASAFVAGVSAGLPDVLDSENAAGREPLGASWSGIKRDLRRKRKSLAELVLLIPRALLALCLDVVARLLPHRGLTHWLATWGLLSALCAELVLLFDLGNLFPILFSLGYLSHLLADSLTVSGVELFAPFYNKPVHLLPSLFRFRYDSPAQWLLVLSAYGLVMYAWYPQLVALAEGVR